MLVSYMSWPCVDSLDGTIEPQTKPGLPGSSWRAQAVRVIEVAGRLSPKTYGGSILAP
ncbi:MAG: hypothetical protein ACRD2Z_12220 [Thermoanaerobaculia bacterium]